MNQGPSVANEYDDTVLLDLGIDRDNRFYVGYQSPKGTLATKCADKYAKLVKAGKHGAAFQQDENRIYFPNFVQANIQKGELYQLTVTGREGCNLVKSVVPQAGRPVTNDNNVCTLQVPRTCSFKDLPTPEALAMRSQ